METFKDLYYPALLNRDTEYKSIFSWEQCHQNSHIWKLFELHIQFYLPVQEIAPNTKLKCVPSLPPWEPSLLRANWMFSRLLICNLLEVSHRLTSSGVMFMNFVTASFSKKRFSLLESLIALFKVESGMQNVWPSRKWNIYTPNHFKQ